jgi:hypothetical protein
MKIYQGNGNSKKDREYCKKNGIGIMLSPGGCTDPKHFAYFAIDNGAYSAFVQGKEWDGSAYEKYLDKLLTKGTPDFIVTPDKVAKGKESLLFSVVWAQMIRSKYPDLNQYLAVQDGMTVEDVEPYLEMFNGIFVGGTLDWKYETAEKWVELAHRHGLPCHIGRVGTKNKIRWAMTIGADSIDSSSWAQNDSYHHIENARAQTVIEVG